MIISSSNHIFNQIRIQAGTWSFFWDHCFRSYNYDKQVSGTAIRITVQYHAPYHILLKVLDLFWIRTWYALSEVLWIYISLNIWPVLALTDKKINKVQPFFGCFPVSSYRTYKLKSLFDAWFIQIMIVIPWVCYHKMYFFYDFRRKAWRRCRCRCQIRINLIIWYIGRSNICCQRYNDRRRISITYQVKFVSKYPSSIVWLKPHFASVSISGHGTIPSFIWMTCAKPYLLILVRYCLLQECEAWQCPVKQTDSPSSLFFLWYLWIWFSIFCQMFVCLMVVVKRTIHMLSLPFCCMEDRQKENDEVICLNPVWTICEL